MNKMTAAVMNDGKIEAVHGLLEQQQTVLLGDSICSKAWQKVSQT